MRLRDFYREGKLMIRFEVEDTGIGIDEAGLDKLFKPFSQLMRRSAVATAVRASA